MGTCGVPTGPPGPCRDPTGSRWTAGGNVGPHLVGATQFGRPAAFVGAAEAAGTRSVQTGLSCTFKGLADCLVQANMDEHLLLEEMFSERSLQKRESTEREASSVNSAAMLPT